ncbi:hypothetical protein [Pseudogemmobacter sonorensis]|uniref:hypothetical protein n=1 Tax=Pseudogemmobacter sonorensis TaxID=2989681 RepID=UPI0036CA9072
MSPGMVSMAELMAALPHILAAPKERSILRQLTFRPGYNQRRHPERLTLTRAEGIPGERWLTAPWLRLANGAPDPSIQVSILPARVHDLVRRHPEQPHPGDTIIADLDMSLANLPEGSILQVGGARLRASGVFNEGCVKWKARYGADARAWIERPGHPELRLRGILCAITADGEVRTGDPITVVSRG